MDVRSDLSYVTIVVEPRSLTVPPQAQGTGTSRSSCLLVWSVVSYKRRVHPGLGSAASLANGYCSGNHLSGHGIHYFVVQSSPGVVLCIME